MAIFTKKEDLSRQRQQVRQQVASGATKTGLALMGYNKKGEKNLFGKIIGTGAPLLAMAQREGAKKIAGKSDTGDAIRNTDKEFYSQKVSQLALTAKIAAMVASGGAAGAASSLASSTASTAGTTAASALANSATTAGTNAATDALVSGATDAATEGLTSGVTDAVTSGVTDAATDSITDTAGSSLLNRASNLVGKGGTNRLTGLVSKITGLEAPESTNILGNLLKSKGKDAGSVQSVLQGTEVGQDIQKMDEQTRIDKEEEKLENEIKKNKKEEVSEEEELEDLSEEEKKAKKKKIKNITSKLGLIGDGIEVAQKAKAYSDAEDKEQDRLRNRSVMSNYNLL